MKKFWILILIVYIMTIPSVLSVNRTEAMEAIEGAEMGIQEMIEFNFSVSFVVDTLISAREDFSKGDYDSVLQKTEMIKTRKEKAYEISDSINSIEMRIEELDKMNLGTTEIKETLDDAKREFEYENYERSDELIDEAFSKISDLEAKQTILKARYEAAKNTIVTFVEENKMYLTITLVASIMTGIIVFKISARMRTRRELKDLRQERKAIDDLIKKIQIDRYQKDSVSKKTYDLTMSKYKKRIREIEKKILILEKKVRRKI